MNIIQELIARRIAELQAYASLKPSIFAPKVMDGRQYADRADAEAIEPAMIQPDDLYGLGLGKAILGAPIRAFHKTNAVFDKFDPKFIGINDFGYAGRGFYFTRKPLSGTTYGSNIVETDLALQNPIVRTKENWNTDQFIPYNWIPYRIRELTSSGIPHAVATQRASKEWTEEATRIGYDGFIDDTDPMGEIVVFDPEKIKIISRRSVEK